MTKKKVSAKSSAQPGPTEDRRPRLHVLAVGINAYEDKNLQLKSAVNDARGIVEVLKAKGPPLFQPAVQAQLLTDAQAKRVTILSELEALRRKVKPHDLVVLFFAGQGMKDAKQVFLLPYDVDLKRPEQTAVSDADLKKRLGDFPCQVLVLLDVCHAEAVVQSLMRDLIDETCGAAVLAAGIGNVVPKRDGHGLFTQAVIEGLGGKAARNKTNGAVYLHHLEQYVIDRVAELSAGRQHPVGARPVFVEPFPLTRP